MSFRRLGNDYLLTILPHRGTALLIESVAYDDAKPNEIVAHRKLLKEDFEFIGHFPEKPVYPGHYQDEMFNLAAAALAKMRFPNEEGLPIIQSKRSVKYKRAAVPGDDLEIRVTLKKREENQFYFKGTIVNQKGKVISEIDDLEGIALRKEGFIRRVIKKILPIN